MLTLRWLLTPHCPLKRDCCNCDASKTLSWVEDRQCLLSLQYIPPLLLSCLPLPWTLERAQVGTPPSIWCTHLCLPPARPASPPAPYLYPARWSPFLTLPPPPARNRLLLAQTEPSPEPRPGQARSVGSGALLSTFPSYYSTRAYSLHRYSIPSPLLLIVPPPGYLDCAPYLL